MRFTVIVISQRQRRAITQESRGFLQREGAESCVGCAGTFLFQGARQLLELFCAGRGGRRRGFGGSSGFLSPTWSWRMNLALRGMLREGSRRGAYCYREDE